MKKTNPAYPEEKWIKNPHILDDLPPDQGDKDQDDSGED